MPRAAGLQANHCRTVDLARLSHGEMVFVRQYLNLVAVHWASGPRTRAATTNTITKLVVVDPALVEPSASFDCVGQSGPERAPAAGVLVWRERSLCRFLAQHLAPASAHAGDVVLLAPVCAESHWSLLMLKFAQQKGAVSASHYDPVGTRPAGAVEPLATSLARHCVRACSGQTCKSVRLARVAQATVSGAFPRDVCLDSAAGVCLYARIRLLHAPLMGDALMGARAFRQHASRELELGSLLFEPPNVGPATPDSFAVTRARTSSPARLASSGASSGIGSVSGESAMQAELMPAGVPSTSTSTSTSTGTSTSSEASATSSSVRTQAGALATPARAPSPEASSSEGLAGNNADCIGGEQGQANEELTIEAILNDRPPLIRRGQRVPAGRVADESDYLHFFLARTTNPAGRRAEVWLSEQELAGALAILDGYKLAKGYALTTTRPCGAMPRARAQMNQANLVELRAVVGLVEKLVAEQLRIEPHKTTPCRVYTGGQLELMDAVYLVQLGLHCHVMLVSVRERRLYVADGENCSLASESSASLFAQLASQLSCQLQEVKFHQQRGIDHCGSSAALIACEFIRHQTTRGPMGEFVYAMPKIARAVAGRCHREPSMPLGARRPVLPPYAAHRCPVAGCGRYFRGASKAPLRMHMSRCHGSTADNN